MEFAAANSLLAILHHGGVDRLSQLVDRLRAGEKLAADHEARRGTGTGSRGAVVVGVDERAHLPGSHAVAPAIHVEAVCLSQRIEDGTWRVETLPTGLGRKQR